MYKFRVITQDKITTKFWLTVVGANSVSRVTKFTNYTRTSFTLLL